MPSNDLLVTVCNVGAHARAMSLLHVDLVQRSARLVDLDALAAGYPFLGMTGIVRIPGGWAIGLQASACALAVMDLQGRLQALWRLRAVQDIHTMVWTGQELLVASTGNNRLATIDPLSGKEQTGWAAQAAEADTVHLNGVCRHNDSVVVSMFGLQQPDVVRSGRVYDVTAGQSLLEGLREPHSVHSDGEHLRVLESATGSLWRIEPGAPPQLESRVRGYARGLLIEGRQGTRDWQCVVGVSSFRRRSRGGGGDRPDESSLPGAKGAWLDVQRMGKRYQIDLGDLAAEVYEIVALGDDERPPFASAVLEAAWKALRRNRIKNAKALLGQAPAGFAQAMLLAGIEARAGQVSPECPPRASPCRR